MINLNTKNRDLKTLSEQFYKRIENKIASAIKVNKSFLNTFVTDKSKTHLGDFLENEIKDLITLPLITLVNTYNDELEQLFIKKLH